MREISASGKVVKLTSLSPPLPPVATGDGEGVELADVFSSADIDRLRELSTASNDNSECIEIKVSLQKCS